MLKHLSKSPKTVPVQGKRKQERKHNTERNKETKKHTLTVPTIALVCSSPSKFNLHICTSRKIRPYWATSRLGRDVTDGPMDGEMDGWTDNLKER